MQFDVLYRLVSFSERPEYCIKNENKKRDFSQCQLVFCTLNWLYLENGCRYRKTDLTSVVSVPDYPLGQSFSTCNFLTKIMFLPYNVFDQKCKLQLTSS